MSLCVSAVASGSPRAARAEEEEELELPPLDGALDDGAAPDDDAPDDDEAAEERGAPDDGLPAEIDPGFTLDEVDETGPADTEPARDSLDVGSLADAVALLEGDDAAGEDRGSFADLPDDVSPFDAPFEGAEGAGTGEDPSSFVDESALPPLDMEEEPSGAAEVAFHDAPLAPLPWERGRWRVAAGLGAEVPCSLVAACAAHVVAAGPSVLIAPGGARVQRSVGPELDLVGLAANDDAIFVVSRRGILFASMDGGEEWRPCGAPWPSGHGGLALAVTPGRLWVREGGALWSLRCERDGTAGAPIPVRREGVRAMVAAGSTLVALVERGADLVIERLRADDEAASAEVLPGAVRADIGDGSPVLAAAAGGRGIGLCAGGGVHLSRDGGRTFRRFEVGGALALAFAGDSLDARVLALVAEEDRGTGLFLAEGGDDRGFARVAEIKSSVPSARASIAWDLAREVVWVACPSGLLAFEVSAQH